MPLLKNYLLYQDVSDLEHAIQFLQFCTSRTFLSAYVRTKYHMIISIYDDTLSPLTIVGVHYTYVKKPTYVGHKNQLRNKNKNIL